MDKNSGFRRRKEQSRERIQRAALELFRVQGVKKTTLAEIARRAGVSPVTIYNHFASKDGLVKEMFKDVVEGTVATMQSILDGDGAFPEKLESLIFAKLEMLRHHGDIVAQAISLPDPDMRELIEYSVSQITHALMRLLEEGRLQGYIHPGISDRSVMLYIEMFRDFAINHDHLTGKPEHDVRLTQELSTLFFYGIMGNRHIEVPQDGEGKEKA